MSDPNWDDFTYDEEEVTAEDAAEIESGGRPQIGLYLCQVWGSKPVQIDFKKYSTLGVELEHKIVEVIEIEKRTPTEDEIRINTGKIIEDTVPFANVAEEKWAVKRRKDIALKIGIIVPGQSITKEMWQKDILGRYVIVRVVDNSYRKKDKSTGEEYGSTIESTKIGFFDGYESAADKNTVAENAKDWEEGL